MKSQGTAYDVLRNPTENTGKNQQVGATHGSPSTAPGDGFVATTWSGDAMQIAKNDEAAALQKEYYARTANRYNAWHLDTDDEHNIAARFLFGMVTHFGYESLLDVGAGTGRLLRMASATIPEVRRHGIEPVEEMRNIAFANGVAPSELTGGDAQKLDFPDASFDLVCAFGVMHHIAIPAKAIREMMRVAKRGIFISDMNCYGYGSWTSRTLKQGLRSLKLWRLANWFITKGRGYRWDEGDGLWYPYSVFDSLPSIKRECGQTYLLKTKGVGEDLYRSCSHLAIFATKKF